MTKATTRSEGDRQSRLATTFGVLAIAIGGVIGIAATSWHYTVKALAIAVLCQFIYAALSLISNKDARKTAAWLRNPRFSKTYQRIVLPRLMRIWRTYCDPVAKTATRREVLRAAFTWRLFDVALLIAVVYPILLLFAPFILWGGAVKLGTETIIDAVPFWDRSHVITFVLLTMIATASVWALNAKHRGGGAGCFPPRCFDKSVSGVNFRCTIFSINPK